LSSYDEVDEEDEAETLREAAKEDDMCDDGPKPAGPEADATMVKRSADISYKRAPTDAFSLSPLVVSVCLVG
jgi:hypothetical protein